MTETRGRWPLTAKPCATWGLPFSTWSLSKLAEHLMARGVVVSISRESIRQILRAGGISWQATKTWNASNDPDFIAKMRRVLDFYDDPPADGRVVCVDEFGPLNLQPGLGTPGGPPATPSGCTPSTTAMAGCGTCSPPST